MSDVPTETDRLVAKMTAMEVMAKAFEAGNPQMDAMRQRRWTATRGFLDEWHRALTPPAK